MDGSVLKCSKYSLDRQNLFTAITTMDIKTVSFSKDYRSSSCSLCSKGYKDFRYLSHEDLDPRKHGN